MAEQSSSASDEEQHVLRVHFLDGSWREVDISDDTNFEEVHERLVRKLRGADSISSRDPLLQEFALFKHVGSPVVGMFTEFACILGVTSQVGPRAAKGFASLRDSRPTTQISCSFIFFWQLLPFWMSVWRACASSVEPGPPCLLFCAGSKSKMVLFVSLH